jgi:hypothetical protein
VAQVRFGESVSPRTTGTHQLLPKPPRGERPHQPQQRAQVDARVDHVEALQVVLVAPRHVLVRGPNPPDAWSVLLRHGACICSAGPHAFHVSSLLVRQGQWSVGDSLPSVRAVPPLLCPTLEHGGAPVGVHEEHTGSPGEAKGGRHSKKSRLSRGWVRVTSPRGCTAQLHWRAY